MSKALVLLLSLFALPAYSKTLTVNSKRTLYLTGPMLGNVIETAMQLEELDKASDEDVYLIINSPGGSIVVGFVLMNTLEQMKSRGVKVHCIVGTLAASMAFNILPSCSHAYAFNYSLLLWHPPRIQTMSPLTPTMLKNALEDLSTIEAMVNGKLLEAMGMYKEIFYHHYHKETLWTGKQLAKQTRLITIIDNVEGVAAVQFAQQPKSTPAVASPAKGYRIIWTYTGQ